MEKLDDDDDAAREKTFALEGAAEALEITINVTKKRIEEKKKYAEELQETLFVVFDTADRIEPSLSIGDDTFEVFVELEAKGARNYIYRRQLRYEFEAEKLNQKLQLLQAEMVDVKSSARTQKKS